MPKKYIFILIAMATLVGLTFAIGNIRERERTEAPQPSRNEGALFVLGSIPYWDQARAFNMFQKHVDDTDALSLFWYRLDENGNIGKYQYASEDMSIVRFAQEKGVKVLALIANLPDDGNWDSSRVQKVIGTEEARRAHIASIMELVASKGYDGINIDYEFLEDSQTEDYTAFVNELADVLHSQGKILVVAIHAQQQGTETRGQDIPLLTGADYLGYMTYDQHYETSDPGANAEIGWMRSVLEYAQSQGVPMKKILLGIPLDGYDWANDHGEWHEANGVDYQSALTLAKAKNVPLQYDAQVEAPYFMYTDGSGVEHQVWFDDARSFKPKYKLAKEFGVGGLLPWKFGAEDERIYDILE
jgi:spore germination protein